MSTTVRRKKPGRTERLAIRITPEMRRAIEEAAEAEHRTISNWLETWILEGLRDYEAAKRSE